MTRKSEESKATSSAKTEDGASKNSKDPPSKKQHALLATIVFTVLVAVIAQYVYRNYYLLPRRISTKCQLPTVGKTFNERIWGTYRSHTYFGLKTRHKDSPLFGMMWYQQPDEIDFETNSIRQPRIRHWCEQGNGISNYAWTLTDGRSFGRQIINDQPLEIITEWINSDVSWSARVTTESVEPASFAFIFYFILQDSESKMNASYQNHELEHIVGQTPILGNYELLFHSSVDMESQSFHASKVPGIPDATALNELLLASTVFDKSRKLRLPSGHFDAGFESNPNVIFYQFNVQSNSSIEIKFVSNGKKPPKGKAFQTVLEKRISEFNKKFEIVYELAAKQFPKVYQDFGKMALSNMLGSLGYAYGYNRVQSSYSSSESLYGPHNLFSTCPSRSVFPRGFLWDEGFHLLLLRKFDPELSLEILTSWLDTMNVDGWIPREMILGNEAENRVPKEFLVQRDSIANPPMLFYFIEKFLDDSEHSKQYSDTIVKLYPRLKLWYEWLNKTQVGEMRGTYRWRGRNSTTIDELNPKTLPSGLDDYPRATHPTKKEYHLDLRCWMSLSSRVLTRLAALAGDKKNEVIFGNDSSYLNDIDLLDRLHWNNDKQRYCDYGLHSSEVELKRIVDQKLQKQYPNMQEQDMPMKRVVTKTPELGFVDDAFGYISLFPLLLRLLPHDSDKLAFILQNIRSEKELWTDYGLRSISASSPYYKARNTEHDPPYWRGAIWININYMMLSSLKYYSSLSGPNRDAAFNMYSELRNNLVGNVIKEYRRTGFLWENYDDQTGKGQGAHPFTGWSSLVLSIMAEKYD